MAGATAGVLAFEPVGWGCLAPWAPLGCFVAVRRAPTPGAAFRRALAFGWLLSFGAIHWLCWLQAFNPVAPLGIVLLGGYIGLHLALACWALRRWCWPTSVAGQFVVFASAWLIQEWLRTLGRLAAPLAQLGHSWATWSGGIQIAAWLGEGGVTLEILVVAGALLAMARGLILRRSRRRRRIVGAVLVLGVLASSAVFFGATLTSWRRRVERVAASPATAPLRVTLVQPNIRQMVKFASYAHPDPAVRADLTEKMTVHTGQVVAQYAPPGRSDLVILPETALTQFDFADNAPLRARVAHWAIGAEADLLLGASRRAASGEIYNSAWLVRADGIYDERAYDKIRLVPFGESLPYFEAIPGVGKMLGMETFAEGREHTLFESGGRRFGVLVCFESTFSQMARAFARRGAEFLVVVTNDAWYGRSAGAAHHHHLSRLRAVETRRWVVRCANTGISSVISPAGDVVATLELGRLGALHEAISPEISLGVTTPFMRLGNAWLAIPALILLGSAIICATDPTRRPNAGSSYPEVAPTPADGHNPHELTEEPQ